MNDRLPKRWCVLLAVAALLGGCAFRPQLHAVAIDHNRLVADTANELALLNILRARDRQPMHFTSMNVLRGNAQVSVSAEVGAVLDEGDLKAISPSLGAGAVSNPSFEIAIYDKQEFQNGIMRPVEPSLYQYFLSNGWPADYLARLLIERIEFRSDGSGGRPAGVMVGALDNDPEDPGKTAQFRRFLAQYDVEIRTLRAPPTPLAPASELLPRSTLGDLSILADGSLYLEDRGEHAGMVMRRGGIEYAGALVETDAAAGSAYACASVAGPMAEDAEGRRASLAGFEFSGAETPDPAAGACTFDGVHVAPPVIVLRSPDAVLYFLGEYLRSPAAGDDAPLLTVWREGDPGARGRRAVVRTRFMGERYAILEEPDDADGQPTGRSMQTLSFLQQLINLHKSAGELPASSSLVVQR